MKSYHCTCGQIIFFENVVCVQCGRELGFLPDRLCMSSLDVGKAGQYLSTDPEAKGESYVKCQNYAKESVCNWMVPSDAQGECFCSSCRLNVTIPDLTIEHNRILWALTEGAKRRLVYSLIRLKLPLANRKDDPTGGLAFRFLADSTNPDGSVSRVMTGHDEGLITLNIAEADDAEREKIRLGMNEPYRTLLGHFRHESGHYYWDRLVKNTNFLEPFRAIFGDERDDYDAALKRYYANGAPPDWQNNFISVYSTAHPWEAWAETWAHYLHIQDTLEVAAYFGLVGKRIELDPTKKEPTSAGWLAPRPKSFEEVIEAWAQLSIALNSINRSMGLKDTYPFVLSKPVVEKLRFVSKVIAGSEVPAPVLESTTVEEPAPPIV